ncbi:carboxylesterase, type B [Mycena sanguinolenta]|nr:carboxylesterase, type B [Mycena sanguinolenta]
MGPKMRFLSLVLAVTMSTALYTADTFLQVTTGSGTLHGFVSPSYPAVRQFLGVPFALPPTGPRRWLPPQPITNATGAIDATSFGPSCPQIPLSTQPRVDVFSPLGGNRTQFFPVEIFSEDCLTLNVWAPVPEQASNLPVIIWFFGGGFIQGGADSLYFNPAPWVQRTQAHIVVTVNFRSNIFGFPNAAGLAEENLGLLDQRLSLEWVRANIGSFGGDTSRMVVWGQSAGAIAIDWLSFAFPQDPIVQGMIMNSGTALFPLAGTTTNDTAQVNFAEVGAQLGCSPGGSQLDCMRGLAAQDIENLLAANTSIPNFLPVPDEHIVFSDYKSRYAISGAVARIPAVIGTTQHEFNALVPDIPGSPFNQTEVDASTNKTFLCTAAQTSQLRQAHGLTTYRFRYDGNFSNISPPEFSGAYHTSELPLIFGTAGDFYGKSTPYEDLVSVRMQSLWVTFATNPETGLALAGWNSYSEDKAVLLGDSDEPVKLITAEQLDGICQI